MAAREPPREMPMGFWAKAAAAVKQKAEELDEQYKLREKAKEIDEKYQV